MLEHISRQYLQNMFATFKRAALIAVTYSRWGGHHHVSVRPDWWWIARFQAAGFVHSPQLTTQWKQKSSAEQRSFAKKNSRGDRFNSQHLNMNLLVFINPTIAARPEHQHLFGGPGCWGNRDKNVMCTGSDAVPDNYLPVFRTPTPFDDTDAVEMTIPEKEILERRAAEIMACRGATMHATFSMTWQ